MNARNWIHVQTYKIGKARDWRIKVSKARKRPGFSIQLYRKYPPKGWQIMLRSW